MSPGERSARPAVTVFLCGDVMTGRGIDQILPHPGDPILHEPCMDDARDYVTLAEQVSGPIPRPVDVAHVWGDALAEWARRAPDVRLVNLETSVTTHDDPWPKGINYRMHPSNAPCLTAAGIDCCSLANNHVLDWGRPGLVETIEVLRGAGLATAGAGRDLDEAEAPAILHVAGGGRVLVFSLGTPDSGIPRSWAATPHAPGLAVLPELSPHTADHLARRVAAVKRPGDVAIASIHWGGNWGYPIHRDERAFAHALVEAAGIDVVHGHSSHHPRGIEVHAGRLILYGAGDFLNDYEGISGHEEYRSDLCLMYFARIEKATGHLLDLRMVPLRIQRFRLNRATSDEARWLAEMLSREGGRLGTRVEMGDDESLVLRWNRGNPSQPASASGGGPA